MELCHDNFQVQLNIEKKFSNAIGLLSTLSDTVQLPPKRSTNNSVASIFFRNNWIAPENPGDSHLTWVELGGIKNEGYVVEGIFSGCELRIHQMLFVL